MKKIFFLSLIILFTTFIGCKKQEQQPAAEQKANLTFDSSDAKTTPVDDKEANNLMLKFHPKAGATYSYRLTSITVEQGVIKADSVMHPKTGQTITYNVNVKINEVDEEGTLDAAFTISSAALTAEFNGKKISYRSGDKLDSLDRQKFIEHEALLNNSFGVRIKSNGEIVEIYKVDKIVSKFMQIQKVKADTIPQQQMQAFKENLTASVLRPVVRQVFREFSTKSLTKGESWSLPQPPLGLRFVVFENKTEYTYRGLELLGSEKVAAIDAKLVSRAQINPQAAKNKINVTKSSLEGSGKLYFSTEKGMLIRSKVNMALGLGINGMAPTPHGMKQLSTDQTTTNTYILELLEVK
ncbi:MAG: DUF6263 family protein [Ignavibacteria bacterium]|nr:DUF6263 family protein [Ignavibacteria bacterium]